MALLGSLDHLCLRAADVEALVGAYCGVLDAAVLEEAYPERARIRLADTDLVVTRGEPAAEVAAAFRIQDAEGFRANLATTSFELEQVEDVPGAVVLTFRDPAGNLLQAVRWGGRVEDLVGGPRR